MSPYYQDESVTLYHGDCLDILPQLQTKATCLLMDPPYAISKNQTMKDTRHQGERTLSFFRGDEDWNATNEIVMSSLHLSLRKLNDRSNVYVWCGHRQFGEVVSIIDDAGYRTRPLAWVKKNPTPVPKEVRWSPALELCVYGNLPNSPWNGTWDTKNVFVYDSYRSGMPGKTGHPTQKPLGLYHELIAYATDPGQLILDPFCGSGTTLVAAKNLGRKAIGIEIEEQFCEMIVSRCAQEVLFAS